MEANHRRVRVHIVRGLRASAVVIVMLTMLMASLLKFSDLESFVRSLDTWSLIPTPLRGLIAIGVPSMELAASLAWMLNIKRVASVAVVGGLLLAFSIALFAHLVFLSPPRCACLGPLIQYDASRAGASEAIMRNGVLLGLLLPGCLAGAGKSREASSTRHAAAARAHRHIRRAQGFTLIELVLVIAIVALLVAATLPSLASVRERSRKIDSMADLRTHAATIAMYTSDFGSIYPYQPDPRSATFHMTHPLLGRREFKYFGGSNAWHWRLLDAYYNNASADSFLDPTDPRDHRHPAFSTYHYASVFLARPEFWKYETRVGPVQWRPTSVSDAQFPAHKGLLFSSISMFPPSEILGNPRQRVRIAFLDGSARFIPRNILTAPYFFGEGQWPGSWQGFGIPIQHTIDGVRGLDVPP